MAWDWGEFGMKFIGPAVEIDWDRVAYGAKFQIDESYFDSTGFMYVTKARVVSIAVFPTNGT